MLFGATYRARLESCGLDTTWPYWALAQRERGQQPALGAQVETWYRALPRSDRTRFRERLLALDRDARHVIGAIAELLAREWLTSLTGRTPDYEPTGEDKPPDLVCDCRGTRIVCQVYAPIDPLTPGDLLVMELERIAAKLLGNGYWVSILPPADFRHEDELRTAIREQLGAYVSVGAPQSWTGAHRLKWGNVEIRVRRRATRNAPTVAGLVGFRSGRYAVSKPGRAKCMRDKLDDKMSESLRSGHRAVRVLFVLHAGEIELGEGTWYEVLYGRAGRPVQSGPVYETAPTGSLTRSHGKRWHKDYVDVVVTGDWRRGSPTLQVDLVAYQNPHARGELPDLPWSIPSYVPSRKRDLTMERVPPTGEA